MNRSRGWRTRLLALGGAAIILATALVILAAGSNSKPADGHEHLPALSLNGSNTPGGKLDMVCGTAVDSRGDVYASDPGRSAIDVFGPGGEYRGAIRDAKEPCGLAVDSKGALYALESGGTVVKYVPGSYPFDGKPAYGTPQTIDAGGEAKGIAVDPFDNRLFVVAGDRVDVYKSNGVLGQNEVQRVLAQGYTGGTFTISFKGETTRPIAYDAGQAEVRRALANLPAIGRGNVLVREGTNGKTDHFVTFTGALGAKEVPPLRADDSGLRAPRKAIGKAFQVERLVRAFSGRIGEGALRGASGVGAYTYDGSGTGVTGLLAESPGLVSSGSSDDEEGELQLASFGGPSPTPAADIFASHHPETYRGYSHYVFVAESSGDGGDGIVVFAGPNIRHLLRIATIDGSQAPSKAFDFGPPGGSIGVDEKTGHLFARDAGHGVVDEFEATGAYVSQIADPAFSSGEPMGIAVDRSPGTHSGTIYASGGAAGVLAFGPLRARRHEPQPDFSVKLDEACGVAVDSDGDVYVAGDKAIRVFDPQGSEMGRIADPREPCKLAVDPAGNIYAVESQDGAGGAGPVVVYEAASYPPSGSLEFSEPKTIAFPEGTAWIAVNPTNDHLLVNAGELEIDEYGTAGEGSKLLRSDVGKNLINALETYNGGIGVCGSNGDIYSLGRGYLGTLRIFVLDPSGTRMLTRIDGSGSPKGPFEGTGASLAVDQSNCHVFITMTEHRIEEYEPSGTFVDEFGPVLPFVSGEIAVDNGASSPNRGDVYMANYEGVSAFEPLSFVP